MLGFIVAAALGGVAVAQAIINRTVAGHWGLGWATVFSVAVTLIIGFAYIGGVKSGLLGEPQFTLERHQGFRWWWVLPGLGGFAIVAGLPFAVEKIGAGATFIVMVSAQVLASLAYDLATGAAPVTPRVILAAILAVASSGLMVR